MIMFMRQGKLHGPTRYVRDPRRLNVLFSRAQSGAILLYDFGAFKEGNESEFGLLYHMHNEIPVKFESV